METASDQAPAAPNSVGRRADRSAFQGRHFAPGLRERRARVAELYGHGLSLAQIAEHEGVSDTTVWSDLVALGVSRRPVGVRTSSPRAHYQGGSPEEVLERMAFADDVLSVAEARRLAGVSREALLRVIEEGRLPARREQRPYRQGRRGSRTHWLIDREDLQKWLAGLGICRYPGCDILGYGPTGCCSGPHAQGVLMAGRARPGIGEKISEARTGRKFGPRGRCARISAGLKNFYESEESEAVRRAAGDRIRESWKTGVGIARVVLELKGSGPVRRDYKRRWRAPEVGKLGGRPRGYTDEQARLVLELRTRNGKIGERAIADRLGLSKRQVHEILQQAA